MSQDRAVENKRIVVSPTGKDSSRAFHQDEQSSLDSLCTGIAIGGPRDGVKLSAQATWDGKVRSNPGGGSERIIYYPGYYAWRHPEINDFEEKQSEITWVWITTEPLRNREGQHRGHPQPLRALRKGL